MDEQPRRRKRTVFVALGGTVLALAALVPVANWLLTAQVTVTGLGDSATVNTAALRNIRLAPADGSDAGKIDVRVDGMTAAVRRDGDQLLLAQPTLPEGRHVLSARVAAAVPFLPDRELTREFTVDNNPPVISVNPAPAQDLHKPYRLSGRVEGATWAAVDDRPVPLAADGGFALDLNPVPATVRISARDAAGNRADKQVVVPVRHPGMRAVHLTALAWGASQLRDPVLQLAKDHRIDAVELDVKDEGGEIGYDSQVPLARQIGAARKHYDAGAVVKQLHAAGLRVVGRVVAFRDPILAHASWDSGHRQRVIQTTDGRPWSGTYGQFAFTNFADPEVTAYNIDLAVEAAKLGFDDILYDYVRRPEGPLATMRIEGLSGTPEAAIAAFLARSRDAVRPHGAFLGASVFGIAADRPAPVAQNIPAIAQVVDYIAPMVYPSHWGPGEYGVAQPESQPYDITARSVAAFVAQARNGNAAVIPWLQAFSLRKNYGPAEVRAQIEAAKASGTTSFLLWNANCRYDPASLDPKA